MRQTHTKRGINWPAKQQKKALRHNQPWNGQGKAECVLL